MSFGSFQGICTQTPLPLCPLVHSGVAPICYARNISLGSTILFQAATCVVHLIAICMTFLMIYHIKSKYTAVGRKEVVMVFYTFLLWTIVEMILVLGVIPTASPIYTYFVAIEIGLVSALIWCLFLNGLVSFQWVEDGTHLSLWSIRLSSLAMFCLSGFIALGTFLNIGALNSDNPIGLFIMVFVVNGVLCVAYVILQILLVLNTLDNRWPLGDIFFGVIFFITAQLLLFVFSNSICTSLDHYIDGMFFGAMFNLLSVMMVYKYWDSITKEDLEFSVGGKMNVWEVREPLMHADEYGLEYGEAGRGMLRVESGNTTGMTGETQPFMVDPQTQHSTMQPWAQTQSASAQMGSYIGQPQQHPYHPHQGPPY